MPDIATITIPANRIESQKVRRTRSIFPAPRFCPMIGPTAPDSAKMMPNATGVRRPAIAIPATAASP